MDIPKCFGDTNVCDVNTQDCYEENQKARCMCKEGYMNVTSNSKSALVCEKIDLCSLKQAQLWAENDPTRPAKLCVSDLATCLVENGNKVCACPAGFEEGTKFS